MNQINRIGMKKQIRNYRNSEVTDFKENQGKREDQIKSSEIMCFMGMIGIVVMVIILMIG